MTNEQAKELEPAAGPWRPMSEAPKDGTFILAKYSDSFGGGYLIVRRHESHPVWVTNPPDTKCGGWNNDDDFKCWSSINPPKGVSDGKGD